MSLSEKALLVQLNVSQWTARKYDRKRSQEVADAHGVASQVGRYNKALLPATDVLNNIHAKTSAIRNFFYQNTLPWGIEGSQLLPAANYMSFTAEFRKHKQDWEYLVGCFVLDYPTLIVDAQKNLKELFDESDYPKPADIGSKFSINLAVFPVPSADFRVAISDEEKAQLEEDVVRRVNEASASAMRETWDRLYTCVEKVHAKLADPSAIFRDSLIENTQEICTLLKRLNFNDDAELENMRSRVANSLASKNPDALRVDPDYRRDTASEARAIMEKMKGFMGVKNE